MPQDVLHVVHGAGEFKSACGMPPKMRENGELSHKHGGLGPQRLLKKVLKLITNLETESSRIGDFIILTVKHLGLDESVQIGKNHKTE